MVLHYIYFFISVIPATYIYITCIGTFHIPTYYTHFHWCGSVCIPGFNSVGTYIHKIPIGTYCHNILFRFRFCIIYRIRSAFDQLLPQYNMSPWQYIRAGVHFSHNIEVVIALDLNANNERCRRVISTAHMSGCCDFRRITRCLTTVQWTRTCLKYTFWSVRRRRTPRTRPWLGI